jgi:hypothetical protein
MKLFTIFILMACALSASGCSHTLLRRAPPPQPTCAYIDWFEIGRADGRAGSTMTKLQEYHQRCDPLGTPPAVDAYRNGRELGLIDFCSANGALEAGRSGLMNHDVCPEHLKETFTANFEIGRRIRALENDGSELKARIDNMTQLLKPSSTSLRAQIEQLKSRRAQIESQIDQLERQAE